MIQKKAFLALLIAPLFFLVACDTSSPSEGLTADQTEIAQAANGKQLFQGIAFGHGPVAAALPEIYGNTNPQEAFKLALEDDVASQAGSHLNMSKEDIQNALLKAKQIDPAEVERLSNSIMHQVTDRILEIDPGYFSRFEGQIRSGSHQDVQLALASMSPMMYSAFSDITGLSVDDLQSQRMSNEKFIVVFVVVAVALALAAAVNVTVAVNVNEVVNVNPLEEVQAAEGSLKSDMVVDLLVRRFAATS
jgi:SdpC family antimicrobial peptide